MRLALISLSAAAMFLAGCVNEQKFAINAASNREIVCIDGVEYIALPVKSNDENWAITGHYKPDGTLYTCTNSVERNH